MRKLLLTLIILFGLLAAGCGPSEKDLALDYHKKYGVPVSALNDDYINHLKDAVKQHGETYKADIELGRYARDSFIEKCKSTIADASSFKSDNKAVTRLASLNLKRAETILEMGRNSLDYLKPGYDGQDDELFDRHRYVAYKFTNAKLEYENELSVLSTGKSTYELTLDNFNKLKTGLPYATVANTFKMPGSLEKTLDFSFTDERDIREFYVWKHGEATVVLMFKNGYLDTKHRQQGLK